MKLHPGHIGSGAAILATLGAGLFWLPGKGGGEPISANRAASAAPTTLDASEMQRRGIRLSAAESAPEIPLVSLPAMIVPPPNARVAVAGLFPGIVLRTNVVEGDAVEKGQVLAVISSRDVLTMSADLARTQARLGVAQSGAARLSQLGREGIVSGARVEEAEAIYREALVDASEKSRILRMAGASGANGTYTLTAPISGRISKASIQAGNPIDGSNAAFVIDSAGRYEIEAQLPERFAAIAKPGMRIRLDDDVEGKVTAVGGTIDPVTRSAMLKASIPPGAGIIAGRTTTVTLFGPAPPGSVTVPSTAVTRINGKNVVFVQQGSRIVRRQVEPSGGGADRIVLKSGIKPGEKVVAAGTSELKSLMLGN